VLINGQKYLVKQKKIKEEKRKKNFREDMMRETSIMEQFSKLERLPILVNHYEEHKAARKAMRFLHRLHFCPKIKLLKWKKS
jgi:hypothetical protein